MWPMLLDLTRDESKRILRRLELEAYSSLVSAFRAQGDLTKTKKKLLQELQHVLSISTERHRAEVRRAINDEQLTTIADKMAGPSTEADWLIEGRRLIPLMPRLVPQTAFTVTANQAVNFQAERNASMPSPSQTGNKDWGIIADEDEEVYGKKKKRSPSVESINSVSAGTQTPRGVSNTSNLSGISPMKITISKSPQTRMQNSNTSVSQTQKVILVSTSGSSAGANMLQRSVSVPSIMSQPKMSIVMPSSLGGGSVSNSASGSGSVSVSNGNLGNIITVVTTSVCTATTSTSTNTTTVLGTTSTAFIPSSINISKPRPKCLPRHKLPQVGQKPGVVIPVGCQPAHSGTSSIQIKPTNKPAIHIKHDCGMKIITQSLPAAGSKILPKPPLSSTPIVVVSGVNNSTTTTASVSMVTRPVSTISVSQAGNSKILNINTQGGRVSTTTKTANVVTVNPKTLHLTAVKAATGGSVTRPNVIVVTKAPQKRLGTSVAGGARGTSVLTSSFEKCQDLVSFIQKQDPKHINTANLSCGLKPVEKKIIVTSTIPDQLKQQHMTHLPIQRSKLDQEGKTSSLLAELIQAAGILPDSITDSNSADISVSLDDRAASPPCSSQVMANSQTKAVVTQALPGNEWFEYDVADDQTQSYSNDSTDAQAIHALLEMQSSSTSQLKEEETSSRTSTTIDLGQLSGQIPQQHFYTIEQAMTLLNQAEKEATSPSTPENLSFLPTPSLDVAKPLGREEAPKAHSQISSNSVDSPALPNSSSTTQVSSTSSELDQIANSLNQEIFQGELDPQTGLFYTVAAATSTNQSTPQATTAKIGTKDCTNSSTIPKTLDLLSSSLAHAQIDLDTYHLIDEIETLTQTKNGQDSSSGRDGPASRAEPPATDLEVLTTAPAVGEQEIAVRPDNELQVKQASLPNQPVAETDSGLTADPVSSARITVIPADATALEKVAPDSVASTTAVGSRAESVEATSIILQDIETNGPVEPAEGKKTESLNRSVEVLTGVAQVNEIVSGITKEIEGPETVGAVLSEPILEAVAADGKEIETIAEPLEALGGPEVTVTVETGGMDTSHMKMEDFTSQLVDVSQQVEIKTEVVKEFSPSVDDILPVGSPSGPETGTGSSSDSQGDGSLPGDLNPPRISKRKRKPPAALDDTPSTTTIAGWARVALALLERICRYRGSSREKGELNAASWFTRPVDPSDAPGYYTIVKQPMDFCTIRKNLEVGQYGSFEDFHTDMLLVRSNCHLYNPVESTVRRDCDEVFTFYTQEYDKMIDKWQKSHVSPPGAKKLKMDKLPSKT